MEQAMEKRNINGLLERIEDRDALTFEEWQAVEDTASTEDLGRLADQLRKALHPDDVVTYVVDRNVNYSNVCFIASRARPRATFTATKKSSARSKRCSSWTAAAC